MIKKPVFINNNMLINGVPCISKDVFDAWYDKEIVSLFENAVTVYSHKETTLWNQDCRSCIDTIKGIVINIQSIKQETAEDILRDLGNWADGPVTADAKTMNSIIYRAKVFLEKK